MNQGALYMIGSALAFSLMTVGVKVVGERLPSQEIVLARAVVSLVLSYGLLRRAGVAPLGTHRGRLILRGFCGFAGLSCVFYSVTHLPLAEATVIQYLHPTFTAILAALTLGERATRRVWGASVVSLLGVVAVARPVALFGGIQSLDPFAVFVAVLGAFFSGAAYVIVRSLAGREDPLVIVLYFPLVTVPATLPTLLFGAVWPRGTEWLWLLFIGCATQLGQVWLTRGLESLPAARATAISYLQVVFAVVWGVSFFSEVPSAFTWIGALAVIAGTAVVALAPARATSREPAA